MAQDVLELKIPSSYDSLETVVELIEEVARRTGISEGVKADLMIALTEAVNNAIQHGNRADSSKQVHIRIETGPGEMTVCVQDEGEGFDVKAVPDPRSPDNLMNVSGRGILMMKAFMDDVVFEAGDGGTLVRMTKSLAVDGSE